MIATAGLFAPTLRYHQGTFYIICTNCTTTSDGTDFETSNFYITTNDILSNQWSDPIFIDFNGIDPSLFWDDDGRAYVQGSFRLDRLKQPSCTIKQFEIDLRTGESLSEQKEIWAGYAKIDSEGPHIYRKDGWYYLLIAEGGTFEYHMLSMARAKSVWGPYESFGQNPVMTSDGKPQEYIQNIGHGELFQDTEGKWWAAVLGIRNNNGKSPMGRETFLTSVEWPKDGWPKISQPKIQFERDHFAKKSTSLEQGDERLGDCYIRTPNLQNYKFTSDHRIFLKASETDLSARLGTTSFIGKRQRAPSCVALVTLDLANSNIGTHLKAGLSLYKDEFRHAELAYDYSTSTVLFRFMNKTEGPAKRISAPAPVTGRIKFKIEGTEESYTFFYQDDRVPGWSRLGVVDARDMTARDFTGTMFGVFATGRGDAEGVLVSFVDFKVSP